MFSGVVVVFSGYCVALLRSILVTNYPCVQFVNVYIRGVMVARPRAIFFLVLSSIAFCMRVLSGRRVLEKVRFRVGEVEDEHYLVVKANAYRARVRVVATIV